MGGDTGVAGSTGDARSKRALTTDGTSPDKQAPQKRSRVSRACDQCRASREKCDGGEFRIYEPHLGSSLTSLPAQPHLQALPANLTCKYQLWTTLDLTPNR